MQKRTDKKAKRTQLWFDSMHELGQWLAATPRTWSSNVSETGDASQSWDLGAGYAGAIKMAVQGWPEGAQRAQEALKAFQPVAPAPETKTDFYGHMPHVARFCAGAPDSMVRHARPPREGFGRVLTIIVPVNMNAVVSADCAANFGLGVAQYVNQLEMDRVRVEVIGCTVTTFSNSWRAAFAWRIKGADQPLDLASMAFALGHPAVCRRLDFALCERCDAPMSFGYGSSVDGTAADIINCPINAYVVNGMNNAHTLAKTPQAALAHVGAEIDKALAIKQAA